MQHNIREMLSCGVEVMPNKQNLLYYRFPITGKLCYSFTSRCSMYILFPCDEIHVIIEYKTRVPSTRPHISFSYSTDAILRFSSS